MNFRSLAARSVSLPVVFPFPQLAGSAGYTFAAATGLVALILGVTAGVPALAEARTPHPAWLVPALYVLDPLLLQTLALVHCLLCVECWRRRATPTGAGVSALAPIATVLLVFVCYYLVNDLVFKLAFDRPRPPSEMRVYVGLIAHYLPASSGGAPSGFASRGAFLALSAGLAAISRQTHGPPRSFGARLLEDPGAVLSIQLVLLFLVSGVRVITGFHYWFDILLGISLGVYVYWLFVFLLGRLNGVDANEPELGLASILFSVVLGLTVVGFSYCRDAERWSATVLGSIVAAYLALHPPRRSPGHPTE